MDSPCCFPENHILEDVNKCVLALQEGDGDTLDRTAGAIRGRSARVANVVTAEMDNYEPGMYTMRVLEAIKVLRDQGTLPKCYIEVATHNIQYYLLAHFNLIVSKGYSIHCSQMSCKGLFTKTH